MDTEHKKNKCMMYIVAILSILLILITPFVVYSNHNDEKESGDTLLSTINLLMNLCGSILILVSAVTKNYKLYCRLRYAIYGALTGFTGIMIAYCFIIIKRKKNYDDLAAFIVCYVIFCLECIFTLMLYRNSSADETLNESPTNKFDKPEEVSTTEYKTNEADTEVEKPLII